MLLYAITKFVVYFLWCLVGLWLLAPAQATLWSGVKYGALRWLIGLAFGVMAAIGVGSIAPESVTTVYFGVYAPLRVVEWAIMVAVIGRLATDEATPFRQPRAWLWILGGIAVSFASDFASPEGMAGKFCVGRCLC